jgi:hypothetical protein
MEASMKLKGQMSRTLIGISFLALDISLFLYMGAPIQSGRLGSRSVIASFASLPERFTENDNPRLLSSVYIEDSLVFSIVQQPDGDTNYVSKSNGELTEFSAASQYGNIGLLAHNYLSGKSFSKFVIGQQIRLEYQDGTIEYFIVSQILRYQALEPRNPFSSFRNLNKTDEILSSGEMFQRVYEGGRHLTFQTCIAEDGISSWGRLFVMATPSPGMTSVASQGMQIQP